MVEVTVLVLVSITEITLLEGCPLAAYKISALGLIANGFGNASTGIV